ncbi:hypothetical protein, unlikely [Trypanosoma brucei gambiense DAL972]|uniref:Uncharacterized protein n=1 Tax=Trypanosoma brucei gambiense (strain MHOM/CI/86/DAL972) TaxID=679716 RepID=C9ZWI6_TRYB9|nr:hypothetical protein, unlikely [Trypanosoma brucei gambiense DAL972]CBH13775.1 hypothetical protein, unlikely [Trypanosoma brucei gambiense DAL972]|eukprot:XP_011776051.1 hypothetical protein, unlikely [Trypanosoma brucei gambiense DAL972]
MLAGCSSLTSVVKKKMLGGSRVAVQNVPRYFPSFSLSSLTGKTGRLEVPSLASECGPFIHLSFVASDPLFSLYLPFFFSTWGGRLSYDGNGDSLPRVSRLVKACHHCCLRASRAKLNK